MDQEEAADDADEEELETVEDARDRLTEEIADKYGQESEAAESLRDLWQDDLAVATVTVNASLSIKRVQALLTTQLRRFTEYRPSLLASPRALTPQVV